MKKLSLVQIIKEQEVLGKEFKIYGTIEEPLFLAKDVAEWIDYSVSNVSKMLDKVDDDEKTTRTISTNGNYKTEAWFLTEDGLYEVLMQSRKPIIMLDMNNNPIACFYSVGDANEYMGKDRGYISGIYHCCKGKSNTAYSYKWKYIQIIPL